MAVITNFGVPVSGETGATLMPKLQYRFRVTFTKLGGTSAATVITRNVVSVTRPALDHDDVTVDTYNSKIRLAGKHTWQDISLVIRDDVDSGVVRELGAQIAKQVDHADQAAPTAGADYKFGMKIEMLDGGNAGSETVIDEWDLTGCFIPSIQYGDLNYGSSEVVQVTATIRYDNAAHLIGSDDQISGLVLGSGSVATGN